MPLDESETMIIEEEVPPTTATRMPIPKREVAATINDVSAQTVQERGQTTFVDALSNVAGVNPSLRYGGFDHLTIRGFGGTDFLILQDGFRDERHPVVGGEAPIGAMAGLDRIEVLKGPASVLYGVSALGGVINIIRKQPSALASYQAGIGMGNYDQRLAWLGATGPVATQLGSKLLYRLDLQTSSSEDFRGLEQRHAGATAALDFQPADAHRFTARLVFLKSFFNTDAGVPVSGGGLSRGVNVSNRYNSPFDALNYEDLRAQLSYSYRVSPTFSFHERFSISSVREPYFSTETLSVAAENPGQVVRETFGFNHHMRPMMGNQLELRWQGQALVEHTLVGGYDFNFFRNRSASGFGQLTPVDLLTARETQGAPDFAYLREGLDRRVMHGVFLSDQARLHDHWRLALGARLDAFSRYARRDTLDPATGERMLRGEPREDDLFAPSYRVGLVYLPSEWLSAYGSFNTSVKAALPSTLPTTPGNVKPEVGRQAELGLRVEPWRGLLSLNLAVFQISKSNLVVVRPPTVATGEPTFDQAGHARSRGAELDLAFHMGRFKVLGGYAYTDARFVRYESEGTNYADKRLPDVPKHTATFWGTYRTRLGFGAGLGGRLGGDAYTSRDNDVRMPRFFIADATLFYERGPARVQLNVRNLFDQNILTSSGRYFVATIYDRQITPGPPRVVSLQLQLHF